MGGAVLTGFSIAIDGPAGSGKSTVARIVAEREGYIYIDTGAMYRAVALSALQSGVSWNDEQAMAQTARDSCIALTGFVPAPGGGLRSRVILNGRDVSDEIRSPGVTEGSSKVAVWPGVRDALVAKMREMALAGSVVMDGRDIGTVVLPNADVKVFLTATPEERARRRQAELAQAGLTVSLDEIRRQIEARDANDSGRAVAPLRAAEDAVVIDTTGRNVEDIVSGIIELARQARVMARREGES